MGDALVLKMIDALRDMAAKVDETVTHEETDIDQVMNWPQHGHSPKRTVHRHRYERDWVAGRLLGMADMAEALMSPGPNLADATKKELLP